MEIAAPTITTKIQTYFRGCRAALARSTSSVRLIPSGVSSNAHAITSAIGNPITTASTINRMAQLGISKNGKTLRGGLDQQPANNRIRNRDLVNIAPLQLGEEVA